MSRETKEWMRRAKTPEIRARVRWRAWLLSFLNWVILASVVGGVAVPIVAMALGVEDYLKRFLCLQLGVTAVVVLGGFAISSRVENSLDKALYADGQMVFGRIDEVITHPGGGEFNDSHEIVVSAVVPGPVTIRRKVKFAASPGSAPKVGEGVRFRHNNRDPDDLDDILFDGWA